MKIRRYLVRILSGGFGLSPCQILMPVDLLCREGRKEKGRF